MLRYCFFINFKQSHRFLTFYHFYISQRMLLIVKWMSTYYQMDDFWHSGQVLDILIYAEEDYGSDVIYINATTWLPIHTHTMTVLGEFCRITVIVATWLEAECSPSLYIIFTYGFVFSYHWILCRQMSNIFTLYWLGELLIHIFTTNW